MAKPAEYLAWRRRAPGDETHQGVPMHTAYPPITDDQTFTALAFLAEIGLDVQWAVIERAQCEWCGEPDRVTTVRVYGNPAADVLHPVELVECCGWCASTVTARALAERDGDAPIKVEVSRG